MEGAEEKEIVIRLKPKNLMTVLYVFVVIVLLTGNIYQFYNPRGINTTEEAIGSASALLETEEVIEEEAAEVEEIVEEPEEVVVTITEPEVNETEEEEEVELLPITGEVSITINKIDYIIKGEDYARVMSVEFVLMNQDVDLAPRIKAWLTSDTEDVKDVRYDWLDAGKTMKKDETKFTFGYKEIEEKHTLKLEVYNAKNKVIATTTKTFSTE